MYSKIVKLHPVSQLFENRPNNSVLPSQINNTDVSRLTIHFDRNIKSTKAHYLYSGWSLIAEIGGYFGLFLGISVSHITLLIDKMFAWF